MMWRRRAIRVAGAALAVLVAIASAMAYPKPSPVPPRWELEFEPGDLRLYVDPVDDQAYWYFVYGVTNRTVLEWVRQRRVPVIRASAKVLRFDPEEVASALRTGIEPAVEDSPDTPRMGGQ